jgi:RES domain-containing protein
MRVWRLDRAGRNPLDGIGGLHAGGRWNPKGTPIVYTSAHLALAVLEKLVHVDPDLLPDNLVAFEIDVPDGHGRIEYLDPRQLPSDWREAPPPRSTQTIGAEWIRDRKRPGALAVPSVVVPREWNILLNPAHPHAAAWKVTAQEPFRFDSRLV